MADPIYDIAAISTNISGGPAQLYAVTTLTSSVGTTRAQQLLLTDARAVMTNAGWTVLSTSTTTIAMYGQAAPWYDPDNVPSWYTENVPWIRFTAGNTNFGVHFGRYNGTTGTLTSGLLLPLQGGQNTVWHIIANPYQVTMTGNNGYTVIMSSLHVPDFVQERVQVKNAIIGLTGNGILGNSFTVDGAVAWTYYESNLGSIQQWSGDANNGIVMAYQAGGGRRAAIPSGSYIWNPADTNMGTQATWWPQIFPAIIGWQVGTAIPTATNTPTAIGMFWDALMVNRDYTRLSTFVGLPEAPVEERRDWLVFGSATSEFPASLLFIIGTSA